MRPYSEAVKADVRRRMSPPQRQSVARIAEELGIHVITLYKWRKAWRLQGEVVPASEKDPEGWSASDKFTVVLETAGLNATELSAYCRERGLYPEQVERWRQAATDANEKPVLTLKEQKELERLTRKDKALAEAAALLLVTKKMQALWGEVEEGRTERCAD
jgi:transposase